MLKTVCVEWESVEVQTRMRRSCYVHRHTTTFCQAVSSQLDCYTSKVTAIISVRQTFCMLYISPFPHQQSGHIDTYLSDLASVPLALLRDVWLSHDSTWLLTTSTAAGVSTDTIFLSLLLAGWEICKVLCRVMPCRRYTTGNSSFLGTIGTYR